MSVAERSKLLDGVSVVHGKMNWGNENLDYGIKLDTVEMLMSIAGSASGRNTRSA